MSCDSSSRESAQEVLDTLLSQERAALDPYYGQSDPSTYVAMFADKVTTFDPWSNGRMDDGAATYNLMGFAGSIPAVAYEIVNPRVDLYGDAALFTFNVELTNPVGETVAVWNTTEVHHRTNGGWELVHCHWSFATPPSDIDS